VNDGVHFGLARVLAVTDDGRPRVQLTSGPCTTATADWALPFRYEPRAGDVLHVIGDGRRCWVTGVAHGRGASHVAFHGHAELRARGALELAGGGGVRIDSPDVRVEAAQLETDAGIVVQRFGDHDEQIDGTVDERAGACERTIEGADQRTAARHETVAARVAKVDGKLLRLS